MLMSIPEEIGRMLPEEIKNIPNQVFYPRLSELAGKRKSGKITREELEEYYLLKGNVVDREVSNSIGEAEAVKRSKEDWEERGRFLDVLDEFLELSPHSNKFNEMDKGDGQGGTHGRCRGRASGGGGVRVRSNCPSLHSIPKRW
jgi:hypothetical protein